MSFSLDRILWSLGLLVLAGAAPAQDDPRALVKKAVKALGGEELLARRGASHTRLRGSAPRPRVRPGRGDRPGRRRAP